MPVAFAPASGYSAENCGTLALGDGDFDVRDALDKGGGVIIVPDFDTPLISRLDDYICLKRTSVPKETTGEQLVDELESLSMSELRHRAKEAGLSGGGSKEELQDRIRAHEAAVSGDEKTLEMMQDSRSDEAPQQAMESGTDED